LLLCFRELAVDGTARAEDEESAGPRKCVRRLVYEVKGDQARRRKGSGTDVSSLASSPLEVPPSAGRRSRSKPLSRSKPFEGGGTVSRVGLSVEEEDDDN
jgi:hypothetical protein